MLKNVIIKRETCIFVSYWSIKKRKSLTRVTKVGIISRFYDTSEWLSDILYIRLTTRDNGIIFQSKSLHRLVGKISSNRYQWTGLVLDRME